MEHISEILKRQTQTNTSRENTDTWSNTKVSSRQGGECPICRGARFVHPLLPSGQPDYSRVIPCRCTRKEPDSREDRLRQYSNLGSLARFTFENLIPQGRGTSSHGQEQFSRAFQAAREFAAAPKGWLVLIGPSGSGKTHLAVAIANERIRLGEPAFYITTPDLLDRVRSSFSPESEVPYDEFFEQVRTAPLLILDDLGVQSATPWAREKLDQLLTSRFNNELPTVIVAIMLLEQMDERLKTRLTDSRLSRVLVLAEDAPAAGYGWGPEFVLQKTMTFISYQRRTELSMEQQDNMDAAYRLAFDFAKTPEGWLVFMGVTGCGKTHLAAAIVNYRYEMGLPALFVVVPDLLDHLRSTFSPESKVSYDQLFESVKSAPLLVLDDFGEQTTNPWVREKLYQLISYRYSGRLPTVITTRLNIEEIMAEVDEAISSRIVDKKLSTTFWIMAPDYRTERKHGEKKQAPRGKTEKYR